MIHAGRDLLSAEQLERMIARARLVGCPCASSPWGPCTAHEHPAWWYEVRWFGEWRGGFETYDEAAVHLALIRRSYRGDFGPFSLGAEDDRGGPGQIIPIKTEWNRGEPCDDRAA